MKSFAKKLAGVALAAGAIGLVGVGVAAAHPGGPDGPGGRRGALMQKFDTNGDGQLDDAERAAMRAAIEARRAEMLAKYDTNHDGQLDDTERQAMRMDLAAQRFRKLDTNGDGVLSLQEFQAGAAQMGPGFGWGMGRGGHFRGPK